MPRFYKNREKNRGADPGELIFIGEQKTLEPYVDVLFFDPENTRHQQKFDPQGLSGINDPGGEEKVWINVVGVHDPELIRLVGKTFYIHPLILEDVMNTGQRAKFETYDDYVFISLKMLVPDQEKDRVITDQLSILFNEKLIITFEEQPSPVVAETVGKININRGNIREKGVDYLAYVLLDGISDDYIFNIGRLGEQIEDLELKIVNDQPPDTLQNIKVFKREINFIGKLMKPIKELSLRFEHSRTRFKSESLNPYIMDLSDIITHAQETIETYRTLLNDYLTLFHTNLSNRMNEIIKVLTLFSAIFIPLTFIAGLYGMNFANLPGEEYRGSFWIIVGIMGLIAFSMLGYFKYKKWL